MICTDEKIAKIFLNMVPQIGPRRFEALLDAFGSAQAVCSASVQGIANVVGCAGDNASAISTFLHNKKTLDEELKLLEKHAIRVILKDEEEYPEPLKHTATPPPVLYLKGLTIPKEHRMIALVGTRKPTAVGRAVARRLAEDLVHYAIITVSGGARGIDTEIHAATLESKGFTIAVMGCGLGMFYPPENRKLFDRISSSGVCMSEFPMKVIPDKKNFPQRNRIISGLSAGTVIIEAGITSGALITARFAAEQGRDVMVVPGAAFNAVSQGNHWLLRQGAQPVVSAKEIVEDVFSLYEKKCLLSKENTSPTALLGDGERKLVDYIGWEPTPIDVLIQKTGLDIGMLMQMLLGLQIKGYIDELPGKNFICSPKRMRN